MQILIAIVLIGAAAFIMAALFFSPFSVLNTITLPDTTGIKTILGYVDWFFPTNMLKALLLFLLLYFTVQFGMWVFKKVNDLPGL